MKIWFVTAIRRSSTGGVNRSINNLAEGLKKSGHSVKMFHVESAMEENYLIFAIKAALSLLLAFSNRPDRIIARSTDGVFCAFVSRLFNFKTKVILFNHGWEEKVYELEHRLPLSIITSRTSWKARLFRFPLLRLSLRLSSLCVCGTLEEAQWIARKYPSSSGKLRVVPNGILLPPSPFWQSQDYLPPSFLMVGGFTWKKNLEYGVQLFGIILRDNPEARLFLVGTGPVPESKQNLLSALGDSIYIVERESPDKMARWYQTCPFLLSTSRYEGGRSFAILEAQSEGMAVFTTDIPSSRETLSGSRSGILLSGVDIEEDARRIISVYKNPEIFREISLRAFRNASRHRIERQTERLINILNS